MPSASYSDHNAQWTNWVSTVRKVQKDLSLSISFSPSLSKKGLECKKKAYRGGNSWSKCCSGFIPNPGTWVGSVLIFSRVEFPQVVLLTTPPDPPLTL